MSTRVRKNKKSKKLANFDSQPKKNKSSNLEHKILLMHGIGLHKEGSILEKFGTPISEAIRNLSIENSVIREEKGKIDIGIKNNGVISISEVHWSENFIKDFKFKSFWIILRLPLILITLLFDHRDSPFIQFILSNDKLMHLSQNKHEIKSYLSSVLRALARITIFNAAIFALFFPLNLIIQQNAAILIVFAVIAAVILFANSRYNLAQQVRMAASISTPAYNKTINTISKKVNELSAGYDSVTLIAHSQGGYLSHNAIKSGKIKVDSLIGVGSGLVPITIIKSLNSGKGILFSWVFFITFYFSLYAAIVGFGPGTTQIFQWLFSLIIFTGSLVTLKEFRGIFIPVPSYEIDTSFLGAFHIQLLILCSLNLALIALCIYLRPNLELNFELPKTQRAEISSYHDFVGRLAFYPDSITYIPVAVFGNFITDHIKYFKNNTSSLYTITGTALSFINIETKEYSDLNKLFLQRKYRKKSLLAILVWMLVLSLSASISYGFYNVGVLLIIPIAYFTIMLVSTLFIYLSNIYSNSVSSKILNSFINNETIVHRFPDWPLRKFLSFTVTVYSVLIFAGSYHLTKIARKEVPGSILTAALEHVFTLSLFVLVLSLFLVCGYQLRLRFAFSCFIIYLLYFYFIILLKINTSIPFIYLPGILYSIITLLVLVVIYCIDRKCFQN